MKNKNLFLITIITLSITQPSFADQKRNAAKPAEAVASKRDVMNGYRLKDYVGFEKKWHLVTVRFRKDKNEMRFTYANDLAWKSLQNNSKDYPDGAVFAKIGSITHDDPAFTSSAVPTGALRYQLMVRNKTKHKATGGWGYGLYDKDGNLFPDDPSTQDKACYACHQIVPERGEVFSQIMQISPFTKTSFSENIVSERLKFAELKRDKLPSELKSRVPETFSLVSSLQGPLREFLFQGTLDEILPTLMKESMKSKRPAALIGVDEKRYVLVYEDSADKGCKMKKIKGTSFEVISTSKMPDGSLAPYQQSVCYQ